MIVTLNHHHQRFFLIVSSSTSRFSSCCQQPSTHIAAIQDSPRHAPTQASKPYRKSAETQIDGVIPRRTGKDANKDQAPLDLAIKARGIRPS
jgi:hypothetical protein